MKRTIAIASILTSCLSFADIVPHDGRTATEKWAYYAVTNETSKLRNDIPSIATNVVTNVVTKSYVENLGISGGSGINTNGVRSLIDASFVGGTNAVNTAVGEYLPRITDSDGNKTAVTIGSRNGTVGKASFANGNSVEASGTYSHAEGFFTKAQGQMSHAEGVMSKATQNYAHADGNGTTASGYGAHAEGLATTASGNYSHASGYGSTAQNQTTFVWQGIGADETVIDESTIANLTNESGRAANNYTDHGAGTFNINPTGGVDGFYIGSESLFDILKTATNNMITVESDPQWNIQKSNYATRSYVNESNSNTLNIVNSWENFLDGSNVVFSITNYISGVYALDEAKLKILELKTNEYHEVYNSRDEILLHLSDFETNKLIAATNALVSGPIAAVNTKVDGKANKAWGQYTSAGGVAPSNTVYMTAPSTVFAGGLEYERVAVGEGMVGILTTKGAPVYTAGDEGTFKFQDDGGTNYFGFSKTDSYTLGCNTDGISVNNHLVTLTYNVTMSGVPCIWYCSTLDVQPLVWEQLNTPDGQPISGASHTVSWEGTPAAGTEVCYINCPEAKGFFKATVEVVGSAKFMTNMPADLSGGIMCTNTANNTIGIIRPSYNGSTVTWIWSEL